MNANAQKLEQAWERYKDLPLESKLGVTPAIFGAMRFMARSSKAAWVGHVTERLSEAVTEASEQKTAITAGGTQ